MGHAASPPRPELLALLRQVKTTPEDEALRLVLADWLEEHGDAADRARAALIRTDAEWRRRAGPGHDETQQRLREQMQALERAYGSEWLGPLRQSGVQYKFVRGLVHVETNVGVVVAWRNRAWPQTEAWAWVERARLVNGAPADVAKLAESPALGSLATLELVAARADGAVALALSPHLGRLAALGLLGSGLRDEHVVELLEAPCLGQLTDLALNANSFGDEAVRALANCPRLANLKNLRLLYNSRLGDEGLVALASSPHLGNLEHLKWNGRGGAAGAQALLDSPHLRKLRFIYGPPYGQLPDPLRQRLRERFALSGHGA